MDYLSHNSDYLKQNPTWHVEDSPWKATQVLKIIERNNLKPKTIAEVGCGAGEILNQLHQRLPDENVIFTGYEISPTAIELAKTRVKPRLSYIGKDIILEQEHFDLLLVMDVIEHVPNYIEFSAALKEKATHKVFHIPLEMTALSILTGYPSVAFKEVGHLHFFTKETALNTLKQADHEIVDHFYTLSSFELNTTKRDFKNKCIHFLRKLVFKINKDLSVRLFGGCSLLVLTK